MITEEILSPTAIATEWTSIGCCKTPGLFFLTIDYYEIPTFLIDEHKSRWILKVYNVFYINTF